MPTLFTKTVGATARDYATPQLAYDDIDTITGSFDLVSGDDTVVFEVYDDSTFTGRTSLDGVTSDATRNVTFEKGSTGRPLHQPSASTGHVWTILDKFVTFTDQDIEQYSGAADSDECVRVGNSSNDAEGLTFHRCIITGDTSVSQLDCLYAGDYGVGGASTEISLYDCLVTKAERALIHSQNFDGTGTHYWLLVNCTLAESAGFGIGTRFDDAGSEVRIAQKNLIVLDTVSANLGVTGGPEFGDFFSTGSVTNADEDETLAANIDPSPTTATDNPTPGAGDFMIFVNLTGGSEDYELQDVVANDIIDKGTGPGLDSDVQNVALNGVRRGGNSCNLGCFEIPHATVPITPHQRIARGLYPRF